MTLRARARGVGVAAATLAVPLAIGLSPGAHAAPGATTVSPKSPHGWAEQSYDPSACDGTGSSTSSQDWVTGPGAPPLGTGSHGYSIGSNGASYEKLRTHQFDGTPLADITKLSYSTYTHQNIDGQAVFLILAVDTTGDGIADDGIFFEPTYNGTVTLDQWQTWDAKAGQWWSNDLGGPPTESLTQYIADNPSATIANDPSTPGGVEIAAGCGAGSWDNFQGNVDALTVGVNGTDTTFDFEPASPGPIAVDADGHASPTDCNASDAAFTTVQSAVDAALPGDTITVCPGTYTEQVTVQKSVTIHGTDESGVVIKAPNTLANSSCINGRVALVDVCGGSGVTVGLNNLTVSGPGNATSCADGLNYGVAVSGNATLNADSDTVTDIRDSDAALSGCQVGIGMLVGRGTNVGTATITNTDVKRYQKGGIVIDGSTGSSESKGTVSNSTINGNGPVTAIAQNGVQVSNGAYGRIGLNSILGNECDVSNVCGPGATQTASAGILLFAPDPTSVIAYNNISGNDMGLYTYQHASQTGTVTASLNYFLSNRWYGAFLDQGNTTLINNIIQSSNVGIEAYSFDPSSDPNAPASGPTAGTLTGNRLSGNKTEVLADQDSTNAPGVSLTAHQNKFTSVAGAGFVNKTGAVIDATKNFWNTVKGPSDWSNGNGTKVSDNVDFFPWYTDNALTKLATCTKSGNNIVGTTGNDILCGTSGSDTISGLAGNDLILGYGGSDSLVGNAGNDAIIGGPGDDTITGGPDADSMQGREGTDTCNGVSGPGDRKSGCEN